MKKYHNYEIKRFIKKKFKPIILSALIIGVILSIFTYFRQENNSTTEEDLVNNESEIYDYIDSQAAYFRFYLEKPDGDPFRNVGTIRELFTSDNVYDDLFQETQIDVEDSEDIIREESGQIDFSSIDVLLDESSNMYVAIFETGNNRRNLDVANYYYKLLLNERFEVLNNLNIYSITNPQLVEMPTDTDLEEAKLTSEQNINPQKYLLYFFIFLIGGVILMSVVLTVFELYSKKLNFSFAYIADESNNFIVVDENLDNWTLIGNYIGRPYRSDKILLTEKILIDDIKKRIIGNKKEEIVFNELQSNKLTLIEETTLDNVNLMNDYSEVIIVVFSGETSREWYETQRTLCKLYNLSVKTVQINL